MRKIREVLRLKYEARLTHRKIADAVGISPGSVSEYVARAESVGLTWDVAKELSDEEVEQRLFEQVGRNEPSVRAPVDFAWVHQELRRVGVTLELLWTEYQAGVAQRADGTRAYQYSQFCNLYKSFRCKLSPSMRRVHRAGEKGFIDFSGKKPRIWNRETGEYIEVELFVMVLGASNYTYARATLTQRVEDLVNATIRGLEYFGGVTEMLVPDQLRSAVKKPDWWEPEINDTFAEMGQHYGTAIVPARPRRPKDKSKVEVGVQVAQRWLLGRLRNRRFFSLEELNEAIAELLEDLNTRPFKKLEGCRRSMFESIDRPALRPLPACRYEIARWKKARVNVDYHVAYDERLYSVPYTLIGEAVEIRATSSLVEVWHDNVRVASHARCYGPKGTMTTCPEHRPRSHRELADWPPARLIAWGSRTGPATAQVVTAILERGPHPECGRRPCLGLLRMGERYGAERLEAACERALRIGNPTRKSVLAILKHGLDRVPLANAQEAPVVTHENIRGGEYFDRREGEVPTAEEIESNYLREERLGIINDGAPEAVAAPADDASSGRRPEPALGALGASDAPGAAGGPMHAAAPVLAALKRAEHACARVHAAASGSERPSQRSATGAHSDAMGHAAEGLDDSDAWPHERTWHQYH